MHSVVVNEFPIQNNDKYFMRWFSCHRKQSLADIIHNNNYYVVGGTSCSKKP